MLIYLKMDFLRLLLLSFLLLLFPLCAACSADNQNVAIEEAVENTASEEKSPLGNWGAILPVPEGIVDGLSVGTVYSNSEQEVIIQYSFGPYRARVTRFFNFSQGKLEAECKNDDCLKDAISDLIRLEEKKVTFSKFTPFGGGFRRRISGGGGERRTPMDQGYETLLPGSTVSYEKIIWLSDEKAQSLQFRFYLIDNVVLGLAVNNPVVVVFKSNLISPYFENNTTLTKMDGNLVDSIYRVSMADARASLNIPEQDFKDVIGTSFTERYLQWDNYKKMRERNIQEAADAYFVEYIKNGISDNLKTSLEKRLERFYVEKETDEINDNFDGKWGTFLPLPEGARWRADDAAEGTMSVRGVYRNSDDEIIIIYSFYVDKNMCWRVFNFSHNELEYECQGYGWNQCLPDKMTAGLNRIRHVDTQSGASINEGFRLKNAMDGSYALRYGGYEVTSPDGDARYEKIIWISPEKHEFWVDTDRVDFDAKEINHIHAEAPYMIYYQLDEKTLLGHGIDAPIVVIFRNDMSSPYFENNPSFIQMDGKRADSVYGDCLSISYKNPVNELLERTDQCFIEFLKGEYPWLN